MKPSNLTGEMIKTWRDFKGWSQEELAEMLGIAEGSLRNYEKEMRSDKKGEPVKIPKLLDWGLAALAKGLKPFSENVKK